MTTAITEVARECSLAVPAYGEPVEGHLSRYQLIVPNMSKEKASTFVARCRTEAGQYLSVALMEPDLK